MISVTPIRDLNSFNGLKAEWDALLLQQNVEHTVFSTHEWYDTWWRSFGNDRQLLVLLAREGDRTVGIAPLMVSRSHLRGVRIRLVGFIENGNSLHNDFLLVPELRTEIIEAILGWLLKANAMWDVAEFKNIPADSGNLPVLERTIASHGLLSGRRPGLESPYIAVKSDWDSFYTDLSVKSRKTLRNICNRMEKEGTCRLQCVRTMEEYEAIESHLMEIGRNSWSDRIGDSIATHENSSFFRELSSIAARKGWLRVWLLSLNDRYVAYEYHLQYNRKIHGMRASYREKLSHLSPGAYLDFNIVRSIFEQPDAVEEYDLGGSFDFYKRKWTKSARQHFNVRIFRRSPWLYLLYQVEYALVPMIKGLMKRRNKP